MQLARRIAIRLKRLVEAPPPRERTVVKIVQAEQVTRLPAGFVVGVYRSGTTLLRYVLDSHSRIAVPPESNFLMTLAELYTVDWNRKGLQGVGLDEAALFERLRPFAGNIFDAYAIAKGKHRWFDKTPSYLEILEFLDRLFGAETRYIMLYRHGLDVAHSMAAGTESGTVFGGAAKRYGEEYKESARIGYSKYWVESCKKMFKFEMAHPERCYRLRYEDFSTDPVRHLAPLFEFLGEMWEPDVLNFAENPHDFGLQDDKIIETKRFQPRIGNYKEWSKDEITRAAQIAGPTLASLGYEI